MQKKMVLILFVFLLIAPTFPVRAQGSQATITLFDRKTQETTEIIDGNTVRLSIQLAAPVSAEASVNLFLDGNDNPVATCLIASGEDLCHTEPFYALGWYWNADGSPHPQRTLNAEIDGLAAEGTLSITVKPRPVVMAHGFLSNWETWQNYLGAEGYLESIGLKGFAVGDGQVPGVLNTGVINEPRKRTNTIAQNANVLRTYIDGVQKQTGAEKVDLLVHSMGGMIARYYIDRIMANDNVAQVIFLGTPMAGSSCVYPLAALGFMLPASLEIQPSYMTNVFNKQIIHRQGVGFHMLAGTFLTDPLTSPCASTPSDTVVSLSSADAIPLDDLKQIPLQHGDLTLDAGVFQNGVRTLLQLPPGSFDPRPDPISPVTAPNAPEQFSRAYTGHIDPGQSARVTIQIDANVTLANFNLYDSSRSLEIAVRGANGNIIQLDAQKNGMMKLDDPKAMTYLGYGFPNPNPGAWVVELKATSKTPAEGADYAVNARFMGGTQLEASTDKTIVSLRQPVRLNASLKGGKITSAVALLRKPDGSLETLPLTEDGGQYSLSYRPEQHGLYNIELNVTGNAADGKKVDRAANLSFESASLAAEKPKKGVNPWVTAVALAMLTLALILVMIMKRSLKKR